MQYRNIKAMIENVLNAKTELWSVEILNAIDFEWEKEYTLESSLVFFKAKQFSNTWTHNLHFCSVCYHCIGGNKDNSS